MLETDLLDVNVWLALVDENHSHHPRARRYWETESARQIAFTRTSMLSMLRLLTNRTVMHNRPFSASEAWTAYTDFRALPEVIWIAEGETIAARVDAQIEKWTRDGLLTSIHLTDAHLAALATATGCRLVSFDADFRRYKGLAFLTLK